MKKSITKSTSIFKKTPFDKEYTATFSVVLQK